jgi:hypothetical protein
VPERFDSYKSLAHSRDRYLYLRIYVLWASLVSTALHLRERDISTRCVCVLRFWCTLVLEYHKIFRFILVAGAVSSLAMSIHIVLSRWLSERGICV